jgi:hypothetical protein
LVILTTATSRCLLRSRSFASGDEFAFFVWRLPGRVDRCADASRMTLIANQCAWRKQSILTARLLPVDRNAWPSSPRAWRHCGIAVPAGRARRPSKPVPGPARASVTAELRTSGHWQKSWFSDRFAAKRPLCTDGAAIT